MPDKVVAADLHFMVLGKRDEGVGIGEVKGVGCGPQGAELHCVFCQYQVVLRGKNLCESVFAEIGGVDGTSGEQTAVVGAGLEGIAALDVRVAGLGRQCAGECEAAGGEGGPLQVFASCDHGLLLDCVESQVSSAAVRHGGRPGVLAGPVNTELPREISFLVDVGVTLRSGPHLRLQPGLRRRSEWRDRKSTRLNSSHANISYAVFCLKIKKTRKTSHRPLGQTTPAATVEHHHTQQ